jgi:ABC-type branched-subunit amino acid transport system ATPase component
MSAPLANVPRREGSRPAEPPREAPLLEVTDLDVAYGDFQVLWQAALRVAEGEIVAVLGPNGAGKSTLMNTISGLLTPRSGRIVLQGERIDGLPAHRTAGRGLAHVLERRRLFPFLTVLDGAAGRPQPGGRPHRAATLAQSGRCSRWSPTGGQSPARCRGGAADGGDAA